MKINEIFKQGHPVFSFEFFPPKNEISAIDFGINVGQLVKLKPSFLTVTYGAGGSTQEKTFSIVDYLQNKVGFPTMAHYTCVNASKEKVLQDIQELHDCGIRNLMLLRGDPPKGETKYVAVENGFKYASELISFVKENFPDICVGAAVFPEIHVESKNMSMDEYIDTVKIKIEAGADFLVTQFFFENDYYFDFLEKAKAAGIKQPILPGIIPITNYKQIKRFSELSGAHIPDKIITDLQAIQESKEAMYEYGLETAVRQCKELIRRGVPGIHFYTLNKSRATVEIFERIT